MRLDLFLKTSRLVKRRALAQELCEAGRVLVNGHEVKPAKDVKAGDVITLKFSSRIMDLNVLATPLSTNKSGAGELYRVASETNIPREKDLWNENPSSS